MVPGGRALEQHLQPFWHQGPLLQKTVFAWTWGWGGEGWFRDDSSAVLQGHLCGPRGGNLCLRGTSQRDLHKLFLFLKLGSNTCLSSLNDNNR